MKRKHRLRARRSQPKPRQTPAYLLLNGQPLSGLVGVAMNLITCSPAPPAVAPPAVRCSRVKTNGRRCTQRAVPSAGQGDLCADHARLARPATKVAS